MGEARNVGVQRSNNVPASGVRWPVMACRGMSGQETLLQSRRTTIQRAAASSGIVQLSCDDDERKKDGPTEALTQSSQAKQETRRRDGGRANTVNKTTLITTGLKTKTKTR